MYATVPTGISTPPIRPYAGFDVVVIGASLGGTDALKTLLGGLPASFPAAILIAQHVHPAGRAPTEFLASHSTLPVRTARDGDDVQAGHVFVASPDHHLLVDASRRLKLCRTPRVKFSRPAIEMLFVSAASVYRERAIGVVLTGCNTDGAVGTQVLKWLGGRVLAQDPATARAPGMPRAAIATGQVDFVIPLNRMAAALVTLVMVPGAADFFRVYPAA